VKCTGTRKEIEDRRFGASIEPLRREVMNDRSASTRREVRIVGIFKEVLTNR
jgi:hypothetical protein